VLASIHYHAAEVRSEAQGPLTALEARWEKVHVTVDEKGAFKYSLE